MSDGGIKPWNQLHKGDRMPLNHKAAIDINLNYEFSS